MAPRTEPTAIDRPALDQKSVAPLFRSAYRSLPDRLAGSWLIGPVVAVTRQGDRGPLLSHCWSLVHGLAPPDAVTVFVYKFPGSFCSDFVTICKLTLVLSSCSLLDFAPVNQCQSGVAVAPL